MTHPNVHPRCDATPSALRPMHRSLHGATHRAADARPEGAAKAKTAAPTGHTP